MGSGLLLAPEIWRLRPRVNRRLCLLRPITRSARVKLARAFEVYEEVLGAGLEASIHARRLDPEHEEFTITLSLADRTPEQLAPLASIAERYDLEVRR
jgi:hypothetical protein